MLRTSRSLLKVASRVPSTAPMTRTSTRLPSQIIAPKYQSALFSSKPPSPTDSENAKKNATETLKSDPSAVSTQSSVRHVIEESQAPQSEHDMTSEIKHDIGIVKDTFKLTDVPRESHILGLAGTLPYFGTSLSTLFLSWDLNREWPSGNWLADSLFVDHDTARHLLSVIEPMQLGYGAVIISFLGAIHWGLEYAEKKPHPERTRFRYAVGLAAPIVAWPTLFMPIEYALTAQFGAFVALYFIDTNAAKRGWAPYWYGTYRFLLTAMVGLALFLSLVGRAKIGQHQTLTYEGLEKRIGDTPGLADHDTDWAKLEKEEKERRRKAKKEAEKKAHKEEQEKKQKERVSEKSGQKQGEDEDEKEAKKSDGEESKDDEAKEESKEDNKEEAKEDESKEDESKDDDKESESDKGEEKSESKDEKKDDKEEESGSGKDEGKEDK